MKKDVAVKRITNLHNTILENVQKLRDYVHNFDDHDICTEADDWCERVEEFLEEDGSVNDIIELLDNIFIDEE